MRIITGTVPRPYAVGKAKEYLTCQPGDLLHSLQKGMFSPVRAIQVEGGSEFKAQFEAACQQRTHREEFYEVADLSWTVSEPRPQLLAWGKVYNTVRPLRVWGIGRLWRFSVSVSAGRRGSVTNVLDEYTGLTPHEPAC